MVRRKGVVGQGQLVRPPDEGRVGEAAIVDGKDVEAQLLQDLVELHPVMRGASVRVAVEVQEDNFPGSNIVIAGTGVDLRSRNAIKHMPIVGACKPSGTLMIKPRSSFRAVLQ